MPTLDINFAEVPDKLPIVEPGVYEAEVQTAEVKATNDGTGQKIEMCAKIVGGPFDGALLFDHLSLKMKTKIKRMFLSAGIDVNTRPADTVELIGRVVKIAVTRETYKDKSGQTRETSRIQDYIIPESK